MPVARRQPWLLAVLLAAAYLILHPITADLAAQVFRADLFAREGFGVWNGQWFGGHHTPGYSLLFPPLAALLGPSVVGALAAVASAVLFQRLASREFGERAYVGVAWFAAGTASNLFTGRLTFALGVAVGLAAVLAAQRGRGALAVGLAALCPLASPVAGLFLALAGLAYALAKAADWRGGMGDRSSKWAAAEGVLIGAAALGTAMAVSVAFPEDGVQPFVWSAFWPTLAFAGVVLVLVPRERRALRIGALLYAVACTGAYFLDTPMGGNAVRLGTMFGGPLLACVLWRRRTLPLLLLVPALLYWQWKSPVVDVGKARGDPSVHASYYAPLNRFLAGHGGQAVRTEIPFTRNHWETEYVGKRFPIARGWERQLDVKYDRVLYARTLDARAYRAWLDSLGVRFVALHDVRPDYSAGHEIALIRGGLPYLRPVWQSTHWRVYEVASSAPLATGAARLQRLGADSFSLRAARAGETTVRVRYTPYWRLERGFGCVQEAPGGWTRLRVSRPGPVEVKAAFSLDRLVDHGPRCRG